MKLSVYQGEKGYRFKGSRSYRIMMDGRQLFRCVRVDTCTGVAWVADTDRNGNVLIDRQKEEVILRRVYGPMRIEVVDGLPLQATQGMDTGPGE